MSANKCIRKVTAQEVHEAWLIETSCMPSDEAATEESLEFRQRRAPDLFWGYFEGERLIGIADATRTSEGKLTPDCMYTHDPDGPLVCLHGLCVHQEFRKKGVATQLLSHFIRNIRENLGDVTKVCLICHDVLVPFYEKLGFQYVGPSEVVHGSKPWMDMEYPISH